MSRRHRALATLLALGLGGCFGGHRREFPPDFPRREVRQGGACPELSGRWETRAIEDPYVWEQADLLRLLQPGVPGHDGQGDQGPRADYAELAQPAADLLVIRRGLNGQAPGEPTTLRRGVDFECEGGALRVARSSGWGNANVCVAKDWASVALWRDAGGGLVARQGTSGLCVGLFADVFLWSADWARFRPVQP